MSAPERTRFNQLPGVKRGAVPTNSPPQTAREVKSFSGLLELGEATQADRARTRPEPVVGCPQ